MMLAQRQMFRGNVYLPVNSGTEFAFVLLLAVGGRTANRLDARNQRGLYHEQLSAVISRHTADPKRPTTCITFIK